MPISLKFSYSFRKIGKELIRQPFYCFRTFKLPLHIYLLLKSSQMKITSYSFTTFYLIITKTLKCLIILYSLISYINVFLKIFFVSIDLLNRQYLFTIVDNT